MSEEGLARDLGFLDTTAIMVGSMIGSGIFIVPGLVARWAPSAPLVLFVWALAGVLIFFGAVTFGELAAAIPESGGHYAFMREAYGQPWAFFNGWAIFAANKTASIAALAVLFGEYVAALLPGSHVLAGGLGIKGVALALILLLTALNWIGVRWAGIVQTISTVLKIVALLLIAAVGFLLAPAAAGGLGIEAPDTQLGLFGALGIALVPALFAFDGWANAAQVGDEVKNPQRNLPLALIAGTALVTAIYLLMNVVYLRVLGVAEFAGSLFPAARVAEAAVGSVGSTLVIVAILVSLFGTVNAVILSGPRVYYAMARDGVFLESVKEVHHRYRTPHVSILLQGAWSAGLVLLGTFEQLLTYIIVVSWLFYGATGAAVFVLRRRRPNMERPYKVWGYPIVPGLFVLLAGLFVLNNLVEDPVDSFMGLLLVASGLPFYLYWTTGKVVPPWLRSALSPGGGGAPSADPGEGDLTESERELLEYVQDLRAHGATFDVEEAAEAVGSSRRGVFEALAGLLTKRRDQIEVGYWDGDLHVRGLDPSDAEGQGNGHDGRRSR